MKFLILLLIVNVYSYELSNMLFISNIIDNKLILYNYDYYDNRTVIIQYENIYEDHTDNLLKIYFNNIDINNVLDNDDIIVDNISTTMDTYNLNLNINYVMNYDVYSVDGNNLNVSIKINYNSDYNINNINHKLILSLSFNGPVNFNGINILEIKDYVIIFNESYQVERFGNYFYIHFETNNIFNNDIIYNFVIKYI